MDTDTFEGYISNVYMKKNDTNDDFCLKDIAEDIGVSYKSFERWVHIDSSISLENIKKLLKYVAEAKKISLEEAEKEFNNIKDLKWKTKKKLACAMDELKRESSENLTNNEKMEPDQNENRIEICENEGGQSIKEEITQEEQRDELIRESDENLTNNEIMEPDQNENGIEISKNEDRQSIREELTQDAPDLLKQEVKRFLGLINHKIIGVEDRQKPCTHTVLDLENPDVMSIFTGTLENICVMSIKELNLELFRDTVDYYIGKKFKTFYVEVDSEKTGITLETLLENYQGAIKKFSFIIKAKGLDPYKWIFLNRELYEYWKSYSNELLIVKRIKRKK